MPKYFWGINFLFFSLMVMATSLIVSNQITYSVPTKLKYHELSKPLQKEIDCLAENVYFEAAHESESGKIAVTLVTLNRLFSGNYAKNICGVVHQKVNGTCQFSWVCDPKIASKRLTIKDTKLYNSIRDLVVTVFLNYENIKDITKGSTYYHADYVNPGWKLAQTIKIGSHIFYKSSRDVSKL